MALRTVLARAGASLARTVAQAAPCEPTRISAALTSAAAAARADVRISHGSSVAAAAAAFAGRGFSQLHSAASAAAYATMRCSAHTSASTAAVARRVVHQRGWSTRGMTSAAPKEVYEQVAGAARLTEGLTKGQRHALAAWLGFCSAWVGSMVVLGGTTRLTRSGLSMTDWKFTGERPPMTLEDWQEEFAKYQASPEFQVINKHMTLDEFKFIYWMEWSHRMWGRVLGFVFAVPAAFFAARGMINRPLAARLGLLFLMGGTQGFVGWWMVRSGLHDDLRHSGREPRVSPYRLAAHLTSAFTIYSLLVWTTLSVAFPTSAAMAASGASALAARALRGKMHPAAALIGVTAVSGAYVAGNDAGRAYNDWPYMAGEVFPNEYWIVPGWRNFFENTAAVQFNHRMLAYATLLTTTALWLQHRGTPLPGRAPALLAGLAAIAWAQGVLGVATLMNYVPVGLGVAHQANALVLFTAVLGLMHTVRGAPRLGGTRVLSGYAPTAAAAAGVLGVGGGVIYCV